MQCSNILRKLRKDKGISQSDAAKLLDISSRRYSKIEDGKSKLLLIHLTVLSDYYEVSADYIVGASEEKKPYPKAKETLT